MRPIASFQTFACTSRPGSSTEMVNGAVAIWGAVHGWGVWSLVAGAQVGAVVGVVVVWRACRWRPAWVWERAVAQNLLAYGRHILGAEFLPWDQRGSATALNQFSRTIGGAIGVAALGILLVALGILMSIPGVPGQGVLTILLGIMLLDFPGKRRLEHKLVSRPKVLKAINGLRHRFGKPELVLD